LAGLGLKPIQVNDRVLKYLSRREGLRPGFSDFITPGGKPGSKQLFGQLQMKLDPIGQGPKTKGLMGVGIIPCQTDGI